MGLQRCLGNEHDYGSGHVTLRVFLFLLCWAPRSTVIMHFLCFLEGYHWDPLVWELYYMGQVVSDGVSCQKG